MTTSPVKVTGDTVAIAKEDAVILLPRLIALAAVLALDMLMAPRGVV